MPRVIKRYANRKLYDSTAKRYVTLEDLATLVEGGEEVKIVDKKSGADITSVVLSKAITERVSGSKGEQWAGASVFTDLIQKRSDAVVGYVKQGFAAGVKTVKDVEEQLQQQWKRVTGNDRNGDDLRSILNRMIEDTVHFLISRMNLPTRSEIDTISERLDEIERRLKIERRRSRVAGGNSKPRRSTNTRVDK